MANTPSADLVCSEIRQIFQEIIYVNVCGVVSALGLIANIINIVVFVKQGFKDRINISLLGLTVADLACVVTVFWSCICISPPMVISRHPFASVGFMFLTGTWPHVCFNRVTSCITAFITLERCVCVTLPLKVKNIFTTSRTKIVIVSIFIAMLIIFSPTYFVNTLQWRFNHVHNCTMLALTFAENRAFVETIMFLIHSVIVSTISLTLVIVCTLILVAQLNYKAKWRKATVMKRRLTGETTKDKKAAKMVIIIAVIFVICFLPSTVVFLIMAYDPDFNFGGKFENCFASVWTLGLLLETISSSTNIFVYLGLNVKFRATLAQLVFSVNYSCHCFSKTQENENMKAKSIGLDVL